MKVTDPIKEQVNLATQRCLHNLSAQIHGGEVISIGTMWERFTWKEKLKWLHINRLCPWIGNLGRKQYEEARSAWYANQDPEDDDFYPYKINPMFEANPKGVIVSDISIRPVQPIEFISLKMTLENGEIKNESI